MLLQRRERERHDRAKADFRKGRQPAVSAPTPDCCIDPAVRKLMNVPAGAAWAAVLLGEAKQQRHADTARCLLRPASPGLEPSGQPARRLIKATAIGRNGALVLPPRSERARHSLGATALGLAVARAGLSQWRRSSCAASRRTGSGAGRALGRQGSREARAGGWEQSDHPERRAFPAERDAPGPGEKVVGRGRQMR